MLGAVAEAADCRPSLAFVAGESGVGKSRLLDELVDARARGGARVLSGECVELGDGELPYAPLVGALRPLVRAGDPALTELPAARPRRARGAAARAGRRRRRARRGATREEAQPRLFEALLAALDRLGARPPAAARSSRTSTGPTARRATSSPSSARNLPTSASWSTMSYRPDELHRRHPLRPLLAVLERTPSARRFELDGLERPEIAASWRAS